MPTPKEKPVTGKVKGRAKGTEVVVQSAKVVRGQRMTPDGLRRYATKYTKKVHKELVASIKKGYSQKDAGLLAGLGKETFDTWLYLGRHEPDRYPEYAQLALDVEKAKAERRAQAVDKIVEVGQSGQPGTWQANAWFLERTDPDNWGRKDKIEHAGGDAGAPRTQINTVVLIDTDAREAARDLLRRVAGHAGAGIGAGSADDVGPNLPIGSSRSMQLEDGSPA